MFGFGAETFISIVTAAVVGSGVIWAIKSDSRLHQLRLDRQDITLGQIQLEVGKIEEIMIQLARYDGRLDRIEDRHTRLVEDVDLLKSRVFPYPPSNGTL